MIYQNKRLLTVKFRCYYVVLQAARHTQVTFSTLHSRLLERAAKIIADDKIACQMNDLPESIETFVKGGGSLTALANY
jgi:hypothetical protein